MGVVCEETLRGSDFSPVGCANIKSRACVIVKSFDVEAARMGAEVGWIANGLDKKGGKTVTKRWFTV